MSGLGVEPHPVYTSQQKNKLSPRSARPNASHGPRRQTTTRIFWERQLSDTNTEVKLSMKCEARMNDISTKDGNQKPEMNEAIKYALKHPSYTKSKCKNTEFHLSLHFLSRSATTITTTIP